MRYQLSKGVARAISATRAAASCSWAPASFSPSFPSSSAVRGFFFVSASYKGRSLLSAATELALSVREAMGPDRPPHLVTLFATPHAEWGAGLADTPQYVRELLTYEGAQPPVVVGGVLRSVAGGGTSLSQDGGPGVALLAAHLPGVKLMPFHTSQSSLPALPGDGWAEVVRTTRAIAGAKAAAAAAASPSVAAPADTAAASGPSQPGGGADGGGQGAARAAAAALGRPLTDDRAAAVAAAAAAAPCARPSCGYGVAEDSLSAQRHQQHQQLQEHGQHGQQHQRRYPQLRNEAAGSRPSGFGGGQAAAAAVPAAAAASGDPGLRRRGDVPSSSSPSSPSPPILSSSPACSVAALLLSTPHFVEVEELLRRFGLVAPGMQVIGGVTSPGAWGDSESNWGAVWLNDRTYAQGAVGCVLQGPFQLDTIVSPGFRGAGPVMRVTQAHGQHVLELDGEPVQRPLQRAISEALNSGELATSLKIGLGDATFTAASSGTGGSSQPLQPLHTRGATATTHGGPHGRQRQQSAFPSQPHNQPPRPQHHQHPHSAADADAAAGAAASSAAPPHQEQQQQQQQQQQQAAGRQFLTRNWFFQQGPPRPVLTVQSSAPIANGTAIQVHLQNYPAAHRHMRDRLREYAERLPGELTAAEGAVGALALSCSALPFFEGPDLERCLPRAAFAGGKVEGEFCSTAEGQPALLHSFTSCMALLRAAGPGPAQPPEG